MIILDTDSLSVLDHPQGELSVRLNNRLAAVIGESICTTIISFEEQLRGWLKQIAAARRDGDVISAYDRLHQLLAQFEMREVVQYDATAVRRFEDLRRAGVRIGTMDLRIAAIALAHDALLISRNLRDFRRVPALRVEDWTKPESSWMT